MGADLAAAGAQMAPERMGLHLLPPAGSQQIIMLWPHVQATSNAFLTPLHLDLKPPGVYAIDPAT